MGAISLYAASLMMSLLFMTFILPDLHNMNIIFYLHQIIIVIILLLSLAYYNQEGESHLQNTNFAATTH